MKYSWQALTLLLAVALVALSIRVALDRGSVTVVERSSEMSQEEKGEMILESILTRSSVRTYSSEAVSDEMIEKLLRAGMSAPTAGNRQPWELVVVTDRETLNTIPSIIKYAYMSADAPLAIIVMGNPKVSLLPEYWVQDCSAVTENILLAAHALGLGAVWCGAYPDNADGRVAKLQQLINAPEEWIPLCVIVVGHPNSEPKVKDKWKTEKIHYNLYE